MFDSSEKFILPFELRVATCTYLDYAIPASILSNQRGFSEIFYTYNIQVVFNEGSSWNDKAFKISPALDRAAWVKMGFLEVDHNSNYAEECKEPSLVVNDIVDRLFSGYYVEVRLNEYYMPCRKAYGRHHFDIHINMIIGVALHSKTFYVAGFSGEYSVDTISFNDFLKAFLTPPLAHLRTERSQFAWWRHLWFWKPIADCCLPISFPFSLKQIELQLSDYLSGLNTRKNDRVLVSDGSDKEVEGTWGINSYGNWHIYLAIAKKDRRALDVRGTRNLWEHKECMLYRFNLLNIKCKWSNEVLSRGLRQIEEFARLIRFNAVVYNRTLNGAYVEKIESQLYQMRNYEEQYLVLLLKLIQDEL